MGSIRLFPTGPFTVLKSQDQEIIEFCAVQERRERDSELSSKFGKESVGLWKEYSP